MNSDPKSLEHLINLNFRTSQTKLNSNVFLHQNKLENSDQYIYI